MQSILDGLYTFSICVRKLIPPYWSATASNLTYQAAPCTTIPTYPL